VNEGIIVDVDDSKEGTVVGDECKWRSRGDADPGTVATLSIHHLVPVL
jgi:hypothetical protein